MEHQLASALATERSRRRGETMNDSLNPISDEEQLMLGAIPGKPARRSRTCR